MDLALLQRLAPLLAASLAGKKVVRVSAPGPSEAELDLGQGTRLLLSWDSARPGIFPVPGGERLPQASTPFSGVLEARLAGAALAGVALPFPGDRVLELAFTAPWPRKGEGPRLVLEAMGRRSNLLLLDPRGRVLASGRTLSPARNPARPMRLGGEYIPPPPWSAVASAKADRPAPAHAGDLAELARDAWSWKTERPSSLPSSAHPGTSGPGDLFRPLGRLRERLLRELAHLREEEDRCRNFGKIRLKGETLLLHLSEIPLGAERVLLPHPADPGTGLEILLDPALSPQENAQRTFDLARRLERGMAGAEHRKRETGEALARAEAAAAALAEGDEAPARTLLDLPPSGAPAGEREPGQPRGWPGPGRRYEVEGFLVLVGRGAADNDRVTFEAAGPGDLWLHARDTPSSHVVILAGKRPVPESVVLRAAALCAGKSGAKKDSAVEVMVTERKWVRKRKGDKPGMVTVARSRTVLARRRKGEEWPG